MPRIVVTVSPDVANTFGSRRRAGHVFTVTPTFFEADQLPPEVAADRELIKRLVDDAAPAVVAPVEPVSDPVVVIDPAADLSSESFEVAPVDTSADASAPAVVLVGDPGDETPPPVDDQPQVDLSTLNVEELRGLARDLGIPVRGTKAELLARLTEALSMKADRMQDA